MQVQKSCAYFLLLSCIYVKSTQCFGQPSYQNIFQTLDQAMFSQKDIFDASVALHFWSSNGKVFLLFDRYLYRYDMQIVFPSCLVVNWNKFHLSVDLMKPCMCDHLRNVFFCPLRKEKICWLSLYCANSNGLFQQMTKN